MVEKLASVDKRQNEVELFFRLEGKLEWDDEWTVDLCEDGTFCQGVGDLGSGDDMSFSDSFESVNSESVSFSYLHDLQSVGS